MMHSKLIIVILSFSSVAFAQKTDFHDFHNLHAQKPEQTLTFNNETLSQWLFSAYKKYISSQDETRCVYSPSCSEYALKAARKKGLLRALPQIIDRPVRCNKHQAAKYPKDPKTGLAIDEP